MAVSRSKESLSSNKPKDSADRGDDNGRDLSDSIDTIRDQLVNMGLTVIAIMAIPGVAIGLLRSRETGWQPLMSFHVCFPFIIMATLILRHKLSLQIRTLIFVGVFFLLSIGGLCTWGLIGMGLPLLMVSSLFVVIFSGLRPGIIAILTGAIIIAAVALGICSGKIATNFDPVRYAVSPYSWINAIAGFIILTGSVAICFGRLHNHVFDLANKLNAKTVQLQQANTNLTTESDQRIQARQMLRKQEQNYRDAFNATRDSIVVHDADSGTILDVNQAMLDIFGYTYEEALLLRVIDISSGQGPYNQQEAENRIKTEANGSSKPFEWHAKKKNGQLFWIEVAISNIEIDGDRKVVAVSRDISERKEAQSQREQLLKELADKNEELQSIVSIASHDLRSPIVNIEGFSGELANHCSDLKKVLKDKVSPKEMTRQVSVLVDEDIPIDLSFIKRGTAKIKSLLDGLLDVSRAGSQEIDITNLDMDSMMMAIRQTITYQLKEKKVNLIIDALPNCLGDDDQINQVFSNLLGNALKYLSPDRKGLIYVSGKIEADQSIYCVEDNGIGIEPDQQTRIFEIFYRFNPGDSIEGEGLGLTIASRITSQNNGKIWVESQPGEGSKFFVALPTAK